MKTKAIAPCQNCQERYIGDETRSNCHMTCEKYLDFVNAKANAKAKEVSVKQILPPVIYEGSWCGERGFRKSWNRRKRNRMR